MKLATYRDGSRDGQLVVVSRDLSQACYANGIATRMREVLDDWGFVAPQLEALSQALNQGRARHAFAFDPRQCMAPLPRPACWLSAAAYPASTERLRGLGLALPEPGTDAPWQAGGSERLLGATEALGGVLAAHELDLEPQLVMVCGDIAQGAEPGQALEGVRLLGLGCAWVARALQRLELQRGQPALHSRPALSFAPVFVTPDELGLAWAQGRARLALHWMWNGRKLGRATLDEGQRWGGGELLAQLARSRPLAAGSLVGLGCPAGDPACLADLQARETADRGDARTGALQPGDSLHILLKNADGDTPFGVLDLDLVDPAADLAPTETGGTSP